jgi:hypothetical protein
VKTVKAIFPEVTRHTKVCSCGRVTISDDAERCLACTMAELDKQTELLLGIPENMLKSLGAGRKLTAAEAFRKL